ncbi:MAG: hypothetical protein BGO97_12100 [Micrococcales bacterium 70-64]|nr:SRPBCC domain-containing protein [Leifsonia sp.]ODU64704.1 MAG: hypothetical protein ABT06_12100 [Leifsonia sp. SCN 70-46]OJX86395.1 MAG: hypothetical protein BGO97_12100 [Micrococcales bacterium 70-64]
MTDLPAVTERDVYITRSFAAPRDIVWKFWTEPARLAEWFGPTGVHTPLDRIEVTLEEGGTWYLGMTDDASGELYPLSATFLKIRAPEYLEVHIATASQGEIEDVILRVQFHDHGETTRMTLHQGPFTPENRDLTVEGWEQSFAKLDAVFEGAAA